MKHFLLFAFTAALMLSGCASDDTLDVSSERVPMRFQISTEALTRFTAYTLTNLQREGFTLKVTTTDSESKTLFQGSVSYNTSSGKWVLNTPNVIYWPYDDTEPVKFDAIIGDLGGDILIDANNYASADLLVCHMTKTLKDCPTGIITLEFSHLLAAATVSVKLDDTDPNLASAELQTCSILRKSSTNYNYTTNAWENGEQQIYFKCNLSDAAVSYVTATSSTVSVQLETTDYPFGGIDAPYLFIPGDYEVSASYMPYDASGAPLSASEKKVTGGFALEAGQIHDIELKLSL